MHHVTRHVAHYVTYSGKPHGLPSASPNAQFGCGSHDSSAPSGPDWGHFPDRPLRFSAQSALFTVAIQFEPAASISRKYPHIWDPINLNPRNSLLQIID